MVARRTPESEAGAATVAPAVQSADRFLIWASSDGVVQASCKDCDHRYEFGRYIRFPDLRLKLSQHDCLRS